MPLSPQTSQDNITEQGRSFTSGINEPALPDGNFIDFLIIPNDEIVHAFFEINLSGDGVVELFENPTVTVNGSAVVPLNMNFNSIYVSMVQTFDTPTIMATGTLLVERLLSGGTKKEAISVTVDNDIELILNKDNIYLIRLTNNSGGNSIAEILFGFFSDL